METKEIIGLNQIWSRKNLDMDFFLTKILPEMQGNFSIGLHSDSIERVKGCDILFTFIDFPFYSIFLIGLLKPKKVVGIYRTWCNSSVETLRKICVRDGIEFSVKEFNPISVFSTVDLSDDLSRIIKLVRDAVIVADISCASAVEYGACVFSIKSQLPINSNEATKAPEERTGRSSLYFRNIYSISAVSKNLAPEIPGYSFDQDIKRWSKSLPFTLPCRSLGEEVITVSVE